MEDTRYVESVSPLLRQVMESLQRFNLSLQDETPTVYDLWNEQPTYIPKHEKTLSDHIKRHLECDLKPAVVNREVEIRPGQYTDIHIDAKKTNGSTLKVIVEVKGDWNPDLGPSMQSQLINGYLKNNPECAGVYLIGRFYCPRWDHDDAPKSKSGSNQPVILDLQKILLDRGSQLPLVELSVLNCMLPDSIVVTQQLKKKEGTPKRVLIQQLLPNFHVVLFVRNFFNKSSPAS